MGGRSWLLIWRGRRLCEGFVLLFSSPLFYFFIFFFLFAGTLFGSRLCRGRLNTSRLRILLLIVRRGQNGMNLIRTSKLISAFNARPRDSQRDPCRHFPCNYGTPGADKGSLAYIVLVFPFWAVVSAMEWPGWDRALCRALIGWPCLPRPSAWPKLSLSIAPSRVGPRLDSPPSLSAACHQRHGCLTPARQHPHCAGSLHFAPFPTCDGPHGCFQLRVPSRCTAIIVLSLADRHPVHTPYSTFSSCTILCSTFDCVYTPRCILTLYSVLLCIHNTDTATHLPLGAVVAQARPDRVCLLPAQNGQRNSETRRRNPPCASTCSIEPAVRMPSCRNPAENPAGSRAKQPQPADPISLVYTARA